VIEAGKMNLDRFVMGFAGVMVLLSLALGVHVHRYWFFFTVFVGLNLLQASFTGFCPAARALPVGSRGSERADDRRARPSKRLAGTISLAERAAYRYGPREHARQRSARVSRPARIHAHAAADNTESG
jgi:hypothetical protein